MRLSPSFSAFSPISSIVSATSPPRDAISRARAGFLIVDEIYQGLSYGHAPSTALSLGEDILALASFSKYFNMTGWRLGWLVAPRGLVPVLEKLAQNLFICPSAVAGRAAPPCRGRRRG